MRLRPPRLTWMLTAFCLAGCAADSSLPDSTDVMESFASTDVPPPARTKGGRRRTKPILERVRNTSDGQAGKPVVP